MDFEYSEAQMREKAAAMTPPIPEHMRDSVIGYICRGRPVGDFLQAVIRNDLWGAVSRGDDENVQALGTYVRFFWNYSPTGCHDDADRHDYWVERGGLEGRR